MEKKNSEILKKTHDLDQIKKRQKKKWRSPRAKQKLRVIQTAFIPLFFPSFVFRLSKEPCFLSTVLSTFFLFKRPLDRIPLCGFTKKIKSLQRSIISAKRGDEKKYIENRCP